MLKKQLETCKDCIHKFVCFILENNGYQQECKHFADRSRFVELPDVGDYDTITTINEAIDHCYEIAISANENICVECKADHMRLCGWLTELKRRRAAEQALKERENEVSN